MAGEENRKWSVLIIEDEPILGSVCSRMLAASGYKTTLAVNGEAARELVQKTPFDVCLSDIRTPVMNGIEFYKFLQDDYPALAAHTILMTGDVMSKEVKEFIETSGVRFILKPFTDAQLNAAISELIRD